MDRGPPTPKVKKTEKIKSFRRRNKLNQLRAGGSDTQGLWRSMERTSNWFEIWFSNIHDFNDLWHSLDPTCNFTFFHIKFTPVELSDFCNLVPRLFFLSLFSGTGKGKEPGNEVVIFQTAANRTLLVLVNCH